MKNMKKIRKAVIPVAGLGTRFLPMTKAIPKEMLPLVDKPVIQYIAEELVASGIEEIIIVTSTNKRAIEDHFDRNFELEYRLQKDGKRELLDMVRKIQNMARFAYVRQAEALGNGHALLQAKDLIGNEPFAFAYGDDIMESKVPAIKQMMETYAEYGATTIGVVEVDDEGTRNYGIIKGEKLNSKTYQVQGTIEKPGPEAAPSHLANPGRYIFNPSIFTALEKIRPGKGGEIWVADAVAHLIKTEAVYARKLEGEYYDCGSKIGYLKAVLAHAVRHDHFGIDIQAFMKSIT